MNVASGLNEHHSNAIRYNCPSRPIASYILEDKSTINTMVLFTWSPHGHAPNDHAQTMFTPIHCPQDIPKQFNKKNS